MTDPIAYQTSHGALLGLPGQLGGLYCAVIMRGGVAHEVVVLQEEDSVVLASGPTFYGWVGVFEAILEAD